MKSWVGHAEIVKESDERQVPNRKWKKPLAALKHRRYLVAVAAVVAVGEIAVGLHEWRDVSPESWWTCCVGLVERMRDVLWMVIERWCGTERC